MRRAIVGLLVAALAGSPAVAANHAPPKGKHHLTAAQKKKRAAAKKRRALARKRALAKRRREAEAKKQAAPAAPVAVAPAVEDPAPAESPSAPAPDTPPAETPAPSAPAPVLAHSVGITARDTPRFFLQLSRTTVAAGTVTVQVANGGEDGHDVRIESLAGTLLEAWDELPSGAAPVTKDVVLAAGTYRVYCSLPGHAAAGMDTRLTVA